MYAITGFIESARIGSNQAGTGLNYECDAIAACVIGGVSFVGGTGKIRGVVMVVLDVYKRQVYALKAIRDLGLPIDRRIRVLFGCDEENGSSCVEHYIKVGEELPTIGFTPDAPVSYTHLHSQHSMKLLKSM